MANHGVERPLLHRFRRCRTAPSFDQPPPATANHAHDEAAPKKLFDHNARPSFRLVGLLLLAYLLAGSTAFYLAMDHMSGRRTSRALDALYFCVVTMTTVGYGDLVPASDAAKLLACAFVFAGVAIVGTFLSKAADYLVEKQEALFFRAVVHANQIGRRAQGGVGGEAWVLRAMETNKIRYKLYTSGVLLAAAVGVGTAFLWRVEGMRPVDAFYCVCATVTTLGYGDQSFSSEAGRAFAVAWITVSTVVVALFFLYLAELYAERRQRALTRWVLRRRITSMDLEAADLDGDRRVGAADFVLYKLKELGKISQEDISEFLEEFDNLDADHSGTLSPYDLAVTQPPEAEAETTAPQ